MAVAGLWTTASDLALFALAIQDALAGNTHAQRSKIYARDDSHFSKFYDLCFSVSGHRGNPQIMNSLSLRARTFAN
jgi:hypothetical protein